ncbi:GlsB/YeaQ/YmgE family stress response membrane protein [Tengunoibacter tsumagoiensis]|uniref:Transglycosylase n=1 Tax=Tengunoibacter tsumagoiensis TaxID=2014871 RepID=A0A401ZZQ2_9CHLR|nr:GlsB/YeaQ/YmgE family stress response membrane protein [Tengunoibacter tsumagoiensis]GCE12323.1 hypothetical protein KTT_21820 [Tengunoibacter tsumagoiensis]
MLLPLADGVTIQLGEHVWSFGLNFILYLVIAAIVGFLAEYIVGWRVPFGIIGSIIAAVIGIWLMTQVIQINGISINGHNDIDLFGVPLIRALIGSIIFVAIWHLLTAGIARRRPRRRYGAA